MEILERNENSLLKRTELSWSWRHVDHPTPSKAQMIAAIVKLEPNASVDRVVVRDVNSRFGQPLTVGRAYVYESVEVMAKEPKYILKRHSAQEEAEEAPAKKAPAKEAPAEEAPAEEAPAEEAPAEEAPAEEAPAEAAPEDPDGGEE
jgi:ribosomal protein S24E